MCVATRNSEKPCHTSCWFMKSKATWKVTESNGYGVTDTYGHGSRVMVVMMMMMMMMIIMMIMIR
jgi:hypothetical protein